MPKPLIAIFSRNPRVMGEIHFRLKSRFRTAVCESVEELTELIQSDRPVGIAADFTTMSSGGHAEDRLLDEVRQRVPQTTIVMITAESCPEPLARRAAAGDVVHLQNNGHLESLADSFTISTPKTSGATDSHTESDTEAVLSGITRRFETNTPRLKQMLADLEVAAGHDVTILLIGETGSGKTYLSRLIHEVSPRRDAPFLTVACGALPSELIESELFGHVKGAFTGAHADKEGKFIAAAAGTVLLDEIDVLGPEQQVKLLRVIETGEFEPVGSNRTLKSRARLVVASNLDLQPLVEQGRFRPDLYYRLNMLKFEIPPLRERKPDVIPLARKFVAQFSGKHGLAIRHVERAFFEALLNYPWPGNVRELENVIQRAVIYSREGMLTAAHLPSHVVNGVAGPTSDPSVRLPEPRTDESTLGQQIALTERDIIEHALFKNNFSRTNTAKDLGISRVTLYNKMKKYGMTSQ